MIQKKYINSISLYLKHVFDLVCFCLFLFLRQHLFYSPGWIQIHYTAKDGLKLTQSSHPASQVLGWQVWATTPSKTHFWKELLGPGESREESQSHNYIPGSPLPNKTRIFITLKYVCNVRKFWKINSVCSFPHGA